MTDLEVSLAPDPAIATAGVAAPPRDGKLRKLWLHRSSRAGLIILGFFVLVIIVGPFLVRGSQTSNPGFQDLSNTLQSPSRHHWFGTDEFGRDELVRLVLGARYTIFIGVAAVAVGLLIGIPLGAISGYYRRWADMLIQRVVDIFLAFPSFLLALALLAALGPGLRNLIIAVALTSFPRYVRLLRASVLSVRELPFVEAARALGVPSPRILWRHVLPNAITPVLVQTPLELGSAILTAAGLGFLGLGVQQPTPEWGSMLGAARDFMIGHASLATFPGLVIVAAILGFNLLGDGLRDVLDPRMRPRLRIRRRKAAA
jgi:peptide/nickel transport system permease protein